MHLMVGKITSKNAKKTKVIINYLYFFVIMAKRNSAKRSHRQANPNCVDDRYVRDLQYVMENVTARFEKSLDTDYVKNLQGTILELTKRFESSHRHNQRLVEELTRLSEIIGSLRTQIAIVEDIDVYVNGSNPNTRLIEAHRKERLSQDKKIKNLESILSKFVSELKKERSQMRQIKNEAVYFRNLCQILSDNKTLGPPTTTRSDPFLSEINSNEDEDNTVAQYSESKRVTPKRIYENISAFILFELEHNAWMMTCADMNIFKGITLDVVNLQGMLADWKTRFDYRLEVARTIFKTKANWKSENISSYEDGYAHRTIEPLFHADEKRILSKLYVEQSQEDVWCEPSDDILSVPDRIENLKNMVDSWRCQFMYRLIDDINVT